MKKFFIYALYSEKYKQFYIGHTDDLKRRFEQHNKGRVNSTKPYRPYKIIYFEEVDTKAEAVKREKELKLTKGRRFLKQFIK
jgi:putative endonuclease